MRERERKKIRTRKKNALQKKIHNFRTSKFPFPTFFDHFYGTRERERKKKYGKVTDLLGNSFSFGIRKRFFKESATQRQREQTGAENEMWVSLFQEEKKCSDGRCLKMGFSFAFSFCW